MTQQPLLKLVPKKAGYRPFDALARMSFGLDANASELELDAARMRTRHETACTMFGLPMNASEFDLELARRELKKMLDEVGFFNPN